MAIVYNSAWVSFADDALMNGITGYLYTFEACDLSVLGTGIGTSSINVTCTIGLMARFRTDGMNECSAHPSRFGSIDLGATLFSAIGWTKNERPEMDNAFGSPRVSCKLL